MSVDSYMWHGEKSISTENDPMQYQNQSVLWCCAVIVVVVVCCIYDKHHLNALTLNENANTDCKSALF